MAVVSMKPVIGLETPATYASNIRAVTACRGVVLRRRFRILEAVHAGIFVNAGAVRERGKYARPGRRRGRPQQDVPRLYFRATTSLAEWLRQLIGITKERMPGVLG